jgi:hypothetical protein
VDIETGNRTLEDFMAKTMLGKALGFRLQAASKNHKDLWFFPWLVGYSFLLFTKDKT